MTCSIDDWSEMIRRPRRVCKTVLRALLYLGEYLAVDIVAIFSISKGATWEHFALVPLRPKMFLGIECIAMKSLGEDQTGLVRFVFQFG